MQNHVLDYLTNIVKTKPEKLAFSNGEEGLTFQEVYDQSRAIGTFLAKKGVYHQPVVVFMNKHPKEVTAFFGVITGGNYYVPIDEEMPASRIQLILDNVQSPVIICDEATAQKAQNFNFSGEVALYDEIAKTAADDICLKAIYDKAIDTDPIYIVFTSGSTGVPKGVCACHRSVLDYIEQLSETLGFNEDTVFGNQTPLYFDACLKELYPTLKFGATTYLIPRALFMQPIKLVEYLNQYQINTVCWVVSALTMISAFGTFKTVQPQYLRNIAFGSEVFPIKQFRIWKEVLPEASFTNLYGPTEGTGMCCFYHVNRDFELDEVIPVGRPFKNTEIILLNDKNERAADGEVGEICIRGTSITLGYYNNPEKTAEAYTQNPLNTHYPELIYRTGDLGRFNEDGDLIFVSRKDYQIKHMGHRIELGEIEANVNMVDAIKFSGCIYDTEKGKIVLYYVGDISEKDLTLELKEKLPRYMVPNKIIQLEEMPLTANGKIDRVTLKNNYKK
ncbi:MAG: amino acid adenylation domain-containing protein [Agathobacter sp.]|uniref:amino acid adenylation domain-containing protein n=1 Tax=Agathobacter sp. TaxID=2021311 RepID=UPI00258C3506|nr:amino acid adenylation domain-containing protein [Agathobacter sp.]MCR5677374.1 amino acid adenylation domain-containing protein [Agathobacter sp.]